MIVTDNAVIKLMQDVVDRPVVVAFTYTSCYALVLHTRDRGDNHIGFTVLTEDDTNWFKSNDGLSGSSYWICNIMILFSEAESWCMMNADKDMYDMGNGERQYGWKVRAK